MPVIEFRTGVDDKIAYACRWLRKAAAAGARTRVIGTPDDLQALDRALWVTDPQGFVPHLRLQAGAPPAAALGRTPIWLGSEPIPAPPPTLLLNIGADAPDDLAGYERVIEVVSSEVADVQAGRERWGAYRRRGLEPKHREGEAAA